MANPSNFKALLVADGSGGHLVPAFRAAGGLAARGASVTVWYPSRRTTGPLAEALRAQMPQGAVEAQPIAVVPSAAPWSRLVSMARLWRAARRAIESSPPNVVVGFGGWVSVPVVLAAKSRGIPVVLHEQNMVLGRANRWLSRVADGVAVSFHETAAQLRGVLVSVTGLPIRERIGRADRAQAAARLGLAPERPTILVLGGSQGAGALNRVMAGLAPLCSPEERDQWQVVHLTGASDEGMVARAYEAAGVRAWVGPFLTEMEDAYAASDVAVTRAGGSTIAELARCGIPAVLIPYPHAGGHQRFNARAVEDAGGGMVLDQRDATPERLYAEVRRLMASESLRHAMGSRMRQLHTADAAGRLTETIFDVAYAHRRRILREHTMASVSGASARAASTGARP